MLLLLGCNNPLSKKYNKDTVQEDLKAINEKDTASSQIISATLIRYSLAGVNLSDITYQKLLDDGTLFKHEIDKKNAEEKALAEKARVEEEVKIKRLSKAVVASVFSIKYETDQYDIEKTIRYGVVMENKSGKEIRAIKGSFQFNDLFNSEIKSIDLTIDTPIKAGKILKDYYLTDYNQFNDEDDILLSKELSSLNIIWKPSKIIFKDGTTLE